MAHNKQEYQKRLLRCLKEYTGSEESFGDAAQLRINPETLDIVLVEDPDEDLAEFDYYSVNDLVNTTTDGHFVPDKEAIDEITDSYAG